jgi:nitrous oxidase accessory protein NosD
MLPTGRALQALIAEHPRSKLVVTSALVDVIATDAVEGPAIRRIDRRDMAKPKAERLKQGHRT